MRIVWQPFVCACAGIIFWTSYSSAAGSDVTWQYVPLRTAEQKAKGYAGGEMGQMAFTMAICPGDPNYLAIGIDTAAVYVSSDGGRSWQLKRRGIMSNGVQSVAFDPKNPRILWAAGLKSAGSMTKEASDPLADGVYRSTDGGENWQLLRNAVFLRRQAQNEYFAFDPASFDGTQHCTVYASTHEDGLLKTTDSGKTWRSLGFPNTHIHAVVVHPKSRRLLFVAADTGLFRSDDGGENFKRVGGGLPIPQPRPAVTGQDAELRAVPVGAVCGLAVNAEDPNIIYVALGEAGIWRSTDGGRTFARRMDGIPDWAAKKKWVRLCISPANPHILYADATVTGGPFPFWTHDGGASWHPMEAREPGFLGSGCYWAEGMVAHPTESNVAFHLYPVRRTADGGGTWCYSSDGISGCRRGSRTSIAFRPDDPNKMVFFHLDHGCALTADGGDTFTYCPPPRQADLGATTTAVGAYDPSPGSRKLISAVGGWTQQRICISEDDGKTWAVQLDTVGNYQFISFHPRKPEVVYAGRGSDSLRSRDGGKTWQRLPHPIKAMFPSDGDIVFATRKADASGWENEVLRSNDQGGTWTPLPGRIVGSLGDVDVDPHDPNRLYAAARGGIWLFDGKGWTKRDERHGLEKDNFGAINFRRIAVHPTRSGIIYAGQNYSSRGVARGVFRSTDRGEHWENITGNLGPDLNVWAITISPHDGTVWLGTDYGNWRLLLFDGIRRGTDLDGISADPALSTKEPKVEIQPL